MICFVGSGCCCCWFTISVCLGTDIVAFSGVLLIYECEQLLLQMGQMLQLVQVQEPLSQQLVQVGLLEEEWGKMKLKWNQSFVNVC